jgi:hypothetical protein
MVPSFAPLAVAKGRIVSYRVYDFGDEIHLDQVAKLAADLPGRRAQLSRDGAQALVFAAPPLDVRLGTRRAKLLRDREPFDAVVSARLYDYGAVSISIEIAIDRGTDLASLIPICDEIYESPLVDAFARAEADAIATRVGVCIQGAHDWRGSETYTVIFLESIERGEGRAGSTSERATNVTADELLAWPPLAKLVVGERDPRALSAAQSNDVLKHAHSYFEDDLVLIDWNSALVLEPSGSRDIPDILEFATSQLLELRYYDQTFDRELARIYDHLAVAQKSAGLFSNRYRRVAREAQRRLMELTEFTERVDNALKIIGDFYLARVYESAVRRFRIRDWQASSEKKEALLRDAHALIRGEIEARRSTLLELVVILLIFAELATALIRR